MVRHIPQPEQKQEEGEEMYGLGPDFNPQSRGIASCSIDRYWNAS